MTPTQQQALEALVGRALTQAEVDAITPLVASGATQAIADILSVGRTRMRGMVITERGVRENLSITQGALFLKTLRELSEAADAPTWLTTTLAAIGVPEGDRWAYFDALQCGWPWLRAQGLDVGTSKVRDLLDLLAAGQAAGGPAVAAACATLKALGVEPNPITHTEVGDALRGEN